MSSTHGHDLRMVVGTAQLGMSYGISRKHPRMSRRQARELVAECTRSGLSWFDTADSYGDSESVLGEAFASGDSLGVNVITKGILSNEDGSLAEKVRGSIQRLGIPRIAMWLLHDESQVKFWESGIVVSAQEFQKSGVVEMFGVSAYQPDIALAAVEDAGLGAVLFPASPFDRRFLQDDVLRRLASAGPACLVRSVFLQGLGLMAVEDVPHGIPFAFEAVRALTGFCESNGVERDAFCIDYVIHRTRSLRSKIVVGVENIAQLKRDLDIFGDNSTPASLFDEWDMVWPDSQEQLVLPYLWPVSQ